MKLSMPAQNLTRTRIGAVAVAAAAVAGAMLIGSNADFMGGTNAAGCDPYTPLCPTTGDLTARPTDITLGGQQVGPHGAFLPPRSTPVSVHNQTATVTLPAGSAAIIQFG